MRYVGKFTIDLPALELITVYKNFVHKEIWYNINTFKANMKIIKDRISKTELYEMARKMFGNLVKATVDVEQEIMVVNGELHADEEALLLEKGSKQENLWGINLYPEEKKENFIEFDSIINLRPSLRNLSRGVDNPKIRDKIKKIVNKLIIK